MEAAGSNQSPFKLPTDEEVFITRETERQKRKEAKDKAKNLKIWDKKTSSCRSQLKRPKDSDILPATIEENVEDSFPMKQRGIIAQAMDIVNQRKSQPKDHKKENVMEFVEQKKEMFLVEMSLGIIGDEIQKLKDQSDKNKMALKRSHQTLKKDKDRFMKHLEDNKSNTDEATRQAEQEAKRKKEKEQRIKELNQKITAMKTEINRNEDMLNALGGYKSFLDCLTDEEFLKEREHKLKRKIEESKRYYIGGENNSRRIAELEAEFDKILKEGEFPDLESDEEEEEEDFHHNEREGRMSIVTGVGNTSDKESKKSKKGMFFQRPEQLPAIFADLEEKNLFLIQMTQEVAHNNEELLQVLNEEKQNQGSNVQNKLETKLGLEAKLQQITTHIRELEEQLAKNKTEDVQDITLYFLQKNIHEVYKSNFDEGIGSKTLLDLLSDIEKRVDDSLSKLEEYQDDKRLNLPLEERKLRELRRHEMKLERDRKEKLMNEKRNQAAQLRAEKISKPTGRRAMFRSVPPERQRVRRVVVENNEDERIKEYFDN
mmetsp:Transcript_62189/g.71288  ORF Transcript_62189/g.71288 Transcript_62189/m.71288 type:complete len:543 (-) Transcript_62189:251-1879(-)|eukprot:CAMPEP_0115013886 /NCGR_PEP_ID=MMETSP0216-20121206/25707_1 /TAXON_ID=223996 /ORGANISM="Protocruzia adherens, Strain Boccale" /LENGTH=542 /DNA_ID=CAMNT_0002383435 /DNA_START=12 /DNA_END=1640 /DNA_ORIENTATION=-